MKYAASHRFNSTFSKVPETQTLPQPAPLNLCLQHTEQRPTSCPPAHPGPLVSRPREHLVSQVRQPVPQGR